MNVLEPYRGFTIELSLQNKLYAVVVREGDKHTERYSSQFAFPSPVEAAEHGMDYVDQVIEFRPLEEEARKAIRDRNRPADAPESAVLPVSADESETTVTAERRKR